MAAATDLLSPARFGYLKPKDVARLAEAYRFSEAAHAGQTRQSGDPYISHPLAVAEILADWHLDGQTLMAALLHDVTEDTSVTKDEISDTFGKPVAELVDGVSKLDKHRIPVGRGRAGRELPQDAARHGARRARHADQARRPPAQHAHARGRFSREKAKGRPRNHGDLRADRQPPRPEHAVPRAAGARLLAPLPDALQGARQGHQGRARQPARDDRQDARGDQEEARRQRHPGHGASAARSTCTPPTAR